ncbi:hypothetical protein [Rhizobium sp. IBUN]|uniref:hypothetical protein n=1 Tax=Rhizobium sp. IBUN TaxID=1042326 RepID=UPI001FDA89C8|nr:hypothetical protein [Rhizobium sp. IBUN]
MSGKVWFITGASRGFGRIWAEAASTAATKSLPRHARSKVSPISPFGMATRFCRSP